MLSAKTPVPKKPSPTKDSGNSSFVQGTLFNFEFDFYAAIQFSSFKVTIQGDNDGYHTVGYDDGVWSCDCNFFGSRGYCSHTMAMERVLTVMIPAPAETE